MTGRGLLRPAVAVAAGLAFASAAMTAYWTFGGTALLDTVGGYPEELARAHDLPAVLVGLLVIAVKSVGGLVALALAVPPDGRIPRRLVVLAGGVGSALLIAYGGLLTAAGALVLTGVVLNPERRVDRRALTWHVLLWDPWFLLWGLALAVATWTSVHGTRPPADPSTGDRR